MAWKTVQTIVKGITGKPLWGTPPRISLENAADKRGDSFSGQITSTVANGTAPLVVTSGTVVTNLNVDKVDGYDFNQSLKTTDSPTFVRPTFNQAQGTSPMVITSTIVVVNLNADMADGYHFNQGVQTTDSPSFNKVTLTVAAGTAPLTVTSSTVVPNLNVDKVDGYDLDQSVKTTDSPTFQRLTLALDSVAGNHAVSKSYVDTQITSVTSTGIPKLNSYPYSLTAATAGQRQFTVPMDLFDSTTDTLMVWIGSVYTPPSDYAVTNTVRDVNGTVTARGYFNLNNTSGVDAGTTVDIIVLKNVPVGADGTINGASLAVNSVPLDRVQNAMDKRGTTMSGQLTSTVATGTAPFVIASTTKVINLNADMVDGYTFNQSLQTTDIPTFAGIQTPNTGGGIKWMSGASQISRIFDNGQLNLWTDDDTYFTTVATGVTARWIFKHNVPSTSDGQSTGTTAFYVDGTGKVATGYNILDGGNGLITIASHIQVTDAAEHHFKKNNATAHHGYYLNESTLGAFDWLNNRSIFKYDVALKTLYLHAGAGQVETAYNIIDDGTGKAKFGQTDFKPGAASLHRYYNKSGNQVYYLISETDTTMTWRNPVSANEVLKFDGDAVITKNNVIDNGQGVSTWKGTLNVIGSTLRVSAADSGGWALGFEYLKNDKITTVGGIGMYGGTSAGVTTPSWLYMGFGAAPYDIPGSAKGLRIFDTGAAEFSEQLTVKKAIASVSGTGEAKFIGQQVGSGYVDDNRKNAVFSAFTDNPGGIVTWLFSGYRDFSNTSVNVFAVRGDGRTIGESFAVGISTGVSIGDLKNNSPWYGIGMSNIADNGGYRVQLAGYNGLSLNTMSHTVSLTAGGNGADAFWIDGTYRVWTDINSYASKASSGYQRFASGVIEQWGSIASTGGAGGTAISFPITFPNTVTSINITLVYSGHANVNHNVGNQTAVGFNIYAPGTYTFYWKAVGY